MVGVVVSVSVLNGCGSTSTLPDARKPAPAVTAPSNKPPVTPTPAPVSAPAAPKPSVPSSAGAQLDAQSQKGYQAALAAMQNKQDANAEALLTAVVKAHPEFVEARTNLGIVLFRLGRYPRAEEELKRVVSDDPNNIVAYNYLGLVNRINGLFAESKVMYLQALNINANYANAQLNLGILYDLYLRDLPKAMESYLRYQKLLPQEDKDVAKWIVDLKRRIESGK
ncbi:MAG: tetratricopeptide repeat protein [Gammaproteobacteria bacterium]|nr:tetratricopeptide repeat protein [Gammaproteobacteria bacterium]